MHRNHVKEESGAYFLGRYNKKKERGEELVSQGLDSNNNYRTTLPISLRT
jgi:hypothetical protein